ncbi:MAG: hypothetical protein QME58_05635 [Bacteroidota bacterium]|nr:hypothetical protein [Bacteroidota bacterium]
MSFDWTLYIELAEKLFNNYCHSNLREAYLRTSLSRLYYGAFGISRNFLDKQGIIIQMIDTHKFVREKYINSSNKIEQEIGNNLRRLWKERKVADYDNNASIDLKRAETAYHLSLRTFEKLRNIGAV